MLRASCRSRFSIRTKSAALCSRWGIQERQRVMGISQAAAGCTDWKAVFHLMHGLVGCAHTFRQVLYGVGSGVSKRFCKKAKSCAYAHFLKMDLCKNGVPVDWKKTDDLDFQRAGLCRLSPTLPLPADQFWPKSPTFWQISCIGQLCAPKRRICANAQIADLRRFNFTISITPLREPSSRDALYRAGYAQMEMGRTPYAARFQPSC